jgi:hypothetical protein
MSDRLVQDARHVWRAGTEPVLSLRALERQLGVLDRAEDVRRKAIQEWIDHASDPIPERLLIALEVAGFRVPAHA